MRCPVLTEVLLLPGWNSPSFSKSLCLETPLVPFPVSFFTRHIPVLTSRIMYQGAVLFKGYLNKQGKNRLVKKWQQVSLHFCWS